MIIQILILTITSFLVHIKLLQARMLTKQSFPMKITACVTKSSQEDCGPGFLHLPIFFLYIHTFSCSAAK